MRRPAKARGGRAGGRGRRLTICAGLGAGEKLIPGDPQRAPRQRQRGIHPASQPAGAQMVPAGDEPFDLAGQLEKDAAAVMAEIVDQIAPAVDRLANVADVDVRVAGGDLGQHGIHRGVMGGPARLAVGVDVDFGRVEQNQLLRGGNSLAQPMQVLAEVLLAEPPQELEFLAEPAEKILAGPGPAPAARASCRAASYPPGYRRSK